MSNCVCRECKHESEVDFNCNKCLYKDRPYADNTVIVYDLFKQKKVFCPNCGIVENEPKFMQEYCRYCGGKLVEEEKYMKGEGK